jgi:hypothetical protein
LNLSVFNTKDVGKRVLFFLVFILIAGLAVLGYFIQSGRKDMLTDPYKAISSSASVVIETIDLQSFINSFTTNKGLLGEALKIKEFGAFSIKVKFLSDQLNKSGYKKLLTGNSAVIAFFLSKTNKLEPVLSAAVASDIKIRQLKETLHLAGVKTIYETDIRGYKSLKIPYKVNNKVDTVYFSIVSGLLICASSRETISGALYQTMQDKDVRDHPGFSRILQASGKNEDKIFLVFDNLPGFLKPAFRPDRVGIADKAGKLAGCAGGDIYLSENGLVLSGYTESLKQDETLFRYKSQVPGLFQTYKILPAATFLFESMMTSSIVPKNTEKGIFSPETEILAGKLKPFTGDEITRAIIDIKERPAIDNSVVIYRLKNRAFAEQIFLDEFNKLSLKANIYYFRPDDQINVPVFLTPYKGFASAMIPGFASGFDDSWFAFYDNYLITGSSMVTISRILYDNLLNKTLMNDLVYRDFESTLPSISGYYFYCVPSHLTDYLSGWLNEDIVNFLRSNRDFLNKIQAAGYQFTASNNMIYNSLSIRFKDEARPESTTEWETLLDTIAAVKPFFFTNHLTGAKEIFIQDLKNNAYLINAAGRILWKVPLQERITGTIYMIDYLRNGKYQLLFSGRNYLHLLDRNGNYVERYPVKLRSPASNSLALFDYDNNRNYRLLIAGEDRMIYAYDKDGNTVKGWKPFRTNGTVSSDVSWLRVSGKDYLIVSDETSVYFLDRSGNKRITLREPVTRAPGSAIRFISGTDPSVVCTAPDGTIQHIYFDGTVRKFNVRKFSFDHSFDIFDVNGDGFGEYIFIDQGILYLYNHNRSELFTREFDSEELGGPINFIFSSSERKIGVFDINKKLIYLIDKNGEIMKGFPLRGASMFSIGKLSDKSGWHLIVGGTDRFLYNYKLETD